MKIALCFYGCVPMDTIRNSAVGKINYDVSIKHWIKNVIKPNNVDIFIHAWTKDDGKDYINEYKPKKYLFEPPKSFPVRRKQKIHDYNKCNDEIMKSVHYSLKKSIDMKTEYENEHNFKYDLVMISRMDIIWFKELILSTFDPQYINLSPWNFVDLSKNCRRMGDIILDYFIITGTDIANKISNLYLEIDKYCEYCAPMVAKSHYLKNNDLLHFVKTDGVKRFHDFILFRNLYINFANNTDEWEGLHKHQKILLKKIL